MTNVLIRKLRSLSELDAADEQFIDRMLGVPRLVPRGADIISEGVSPTDVRLVLSGLACRYKLLVDGGRQITAYLIPGDFCDLHVFVLRKMDHSIGVLSDAVVVDIPRKAILMMLERPKLATALWKAVLVDEGTLREWVVNVGRRSAVEAIAHLFCEIYVRMRAVGLTSGGSVSLPITQAELADTTGLSAVHVNRSLQDLRSAGLIAFVSGQLSIHNFEALAKFSGFEPAYLHLENTAPISATEAPAVRATGPRP